MVEDCSHNLGHATVNSPKSTGAHTALEGYSHTHTRVLRLGIDRLLRGRRGRRARMDAPLLLLWRVGEKIAVYAKTFGERRWKGGRGLNYDTV